MPPEFRPWPKIARLNRDIVITEKIDGTNAAVGITEDGEVYAQSRTRIITPQADNFGFARWVADNEDALREKLGVGLHFGEWWGSGIQRGYGLPQGQRRFSLFNASRWRQDPSMYEPDALVRVVPTLYYGPFSEAVIKECLDILRKGGSHAAPFMNPEGIVVFHTASSTMYKVTLENDEAPKSSIRGAE